MLLSLLKFFTITRKLISMLCEYCPVIFGLFIRMGWSTDYFKWFKSSWQHVASFFQCPTSSPHYSSSIQLLTSSFQWFKFLPNVSQALPITQALYNYLLALFSALPALSSNQLGFQAFPKASRALPITHTLFLVFCELFPVIGLVRKLFPMV